MLGCLEDTAINSVKARVGINVIEFVTYRLWCMRNVEFEIIIVESGDSESCTWRAVNGADKVIGNT